MRSNAAPSETITSKYDLDKLVNREEFNPKYGTQYEGQMMLAQDVDTELPMSDRSLPSLYIKHGKGVQVWPDGGEYDGYWYNNKINGKGKFIYANGDTYEGDFEDGKAHGKGIYIQRSGEIYEGEW